MGRKNRNAGTPRFDPTEPQRVRWKEGTGWRTGRLVIDLITPKGELRVTDDRTGQDHRIAAGELQRLVRGPRGGKHWKPYTAAEIAASLAAPKPARKTARLHALRGCDELSLFGGDAA